MARLLPALVILTGLIGSCARDAPSKPVPDLVGRWYDERGKPAPNGLNGEPLVLHVFYGHPHCKWDSVVFLHLAWPAGGGIQRVITNDRIRQYIRDPSGVVSDELARRLDTDASLPAAARFTGYSRRGSELRLSNLNDQPYAYLVGHDTIERSPRMMRMTACG